MAEHIAADFEAYAARFPEHVRRELHAMRRAILDAAPDATQTISYGMPAFRLGRGRLVWFAAHARHIGLYPGAATVAAFAGELTPYATAKGSVRFPLDRPLPLELISRIVAYRAGHSRATRTP